MKQMVLKNTLLLVLIASAVAQSSYLSCSATDGSSYNPRNQACIVCTTLPMAACVSSSGCSYVNQACSPVQIANMNSFTQCTSMDPAFGYYLGTCYNCSLNTTQNQCNAQGNACKYVGTSCVGMAASDYGANYQTCTSVSSSPTYSALGWRASQQPNCVNCQAVDVNDCNNTTGCILSSNGTACGGMLVSSGNYNNNQPDCLSLGSGFTYIYNTNQQPECLDCGSLDDNDCQAQSAYCVMSSSSQCLGRQPTDSTQTRSSLVSRILPTGNPQDYTQCLSLSPNNGWNALQQQCVDCSQYLNRQSCQDVIYCKYQQNNVSGYSCVGTTMADYSQNYQLCLSADSQFGFNIVSSGSSITGTCINCSQYTDTSSCSNVSYCSWQGTRCERYRPQYTTCDEINNMYQCLPINMSDGSQIICEWNIAFASCVQKSCFDLNQNDCTSINNQQCQYVNNQCVPYDCNSLTTQSTCSAYEDTVYNQLTYCTWSSPLSSCVNYNRNYLCLSYLNEQSCLQNTEGFTCQWLPTQVCQYVTCSSLQQSQCEAYSVFGTQLNYQYCLWIQQPNSETFSCVTFDVVICRLIETEEICLSNNDASGLTCEWTNNACSTVTCSSIIAQNCPTLSNSNNTVNGMHCYIGTNGECTLAPIDITCSQFTEQPGCNQYPNISNQICSWNSGTNTCQLATCETLTQEQCNIASTVSVLANGGLCIWVSDSCTQAACPLITNQDTCQSFAIQQLNGSNCSYQDGQCIVVSSNNTYNCNVYSTSDLCNNQVDSSGFQCYWNSNVCSPFQCGFITVETTCNSYAVPSNPINQFYCYYNTTTSVCTQILETNYGCQAFNGYPQLCQQYNLYQKPDNLGTCLYSLSLQTCFNAQITSASNSNYSCQSFNQQKDCEQALMYPGLQASVLCQWTGSSCIMLQGNSCSGIITQASCANAKLPGYYGCIWDNDNNVCRQDLCQYAEQYQCLSAPASSNCYWNAINQQQPYCTRYTMQAIGITSEQCSYMGGYYYQIYGNQCSTQTCSNILTQTECAYSTGLFNVPLQCFWYDNICQPVTNVLPCQTQMNQQFECSTLSNTIGQCFSQGNYYGWNFECVNCQAILAQPTCNQTGSACFWSTSSNACIGQRPNNNGPAYQSYESCQNIDPVLGYSSLTDIGPQCIDCSQFTTTTQCQNLLGCNWQTLTMTDSGTVSYCTGLRPDDEFNSSPASRISCKLIPQQQYCWDGILSNCFDCGVYTDQTSCVDNPRCVWNVSCIGIRACEAFNTLQGCNTNHNCTWTNDICTGYADTVFTYQNCAALGEVWGWTQSSNTCVVCRYITQPDCPPGACYWDTNLRLCIGLREYTQQITLAQCLSFGPQYGYSSQAQDLTYCVDCSQLASQSRCNAYPDYCSWTSSNGCVGLTPDTVSDFWSCYNFNPAYGFTVSTQSCDICSQYSSEECRPVQACVVSSTNTCVGKSLANYDNSDCLNLGDTFNVDANGDCSDCSVNTNQQTCDSNPLCRYQMSGAYPHLFQCQRYRECYYQCNQITSQYNCRDLYFDNQTMMTCIWSNNACVQPSCTDFTNQSTCVSTSTDGFAPNCSWTSNSCVNKQCSSINNQQDCSQYLVKQLNGSNCTWDSTNNVCASLATTRSSCSIYLSQQDCNQILKPSQTTGIICNWVNSGTTSSCLMASCSGLTSQSTCQTFANIQLNGVYCYWSVATTTGTTPFCNSLPTSYTCSGFNNQDACLLSPTNTCTWINDQCITRTCNLQQQEASCNIYSVTQLNGNYCVWNPANTSTSTVSLGASQVTLLNSCQNAVSLTCASFLTQTACGQFPNGANNICTWNSQNQVCGNAQCQNLTQQQCMMYLTVSLNGAGTCYWNGNQCATLQSSASCDIFQTSTACAQQTVIKTSCVWNDTLSPAQCQVGACGAFVSESTCMVYSNMPLNGNTCLWGASQQCVSNNSLSCASFTTSMSCTNFVQNGQYACSWPQGSCQSMECSDLTESQCNDYPFGLPNGTFCDFVAGQCKTLGSNACTAITTQNICLNTQFPNSSDCYWNSTGTGTCVQATCSLFTTSCDCNSQMQYPTCIFNFTSNQCISPTCTTAGVTQTLCGYMSNCSWDTNTSSCIVAPSGSSSTTGTIPSPSTSTSTNTASSTSSQPTPTISSTYGLLPQAVAMATMLYLVI